MLRQGQPKQVLLVLGKKSARAPIALWSTVDLHCKSGPCTNARTRILLSRICSLIFSPQTNACFAFAIVRRRAELDDILKTKGARGTAADPTSENSNVRSTQPQSFFVVIFLFSFFYMAYPRLFSHTCSLSPPLSILLSIWSL